MSYPLIGPELARQRHEELVRAAAEHRLARAALDRRTAPDPVRCTWPARIQARLGRSRRLPGLAAPAPPC